MAPSVLTKKVLEDFIEIYKTHPCLWQIKSKEYRNRDKTEAAYKLLIEKLREIEPKANKVVVAQKIQNLRKCVRKTKKRYEQSLKTAASADEVNPITLWYYDLFNFLHDQWEFKESSSNFKGDNTQESLAFDQQYSFNGETVTCETIDNNEAQSRSSNNYSSRPPKSGKVKRKNETIADESVRDHFKRPRDLTEDRYDVFGKNVAMELRVLDSNKILVVEKAINDLLYEEELGNLTPDHAYINMRDILRQNQRSCSAINVPAQQYQQQVHYQSSPSTFNRSYTPVSFVSPGSPSPHCLPFTSGQHSQHISQLLQTSQLNNSHPANTYSTQMQTPIHPDEIGAALSIPDSAASFISDFNLLLDIMTS